MGKQKILQQGPKAIPQLISLLSDLAHYRMKLRYATGTEKEGESAWKELDKGEEDPRLFDRWRSLEISWRLQLDVCELVGRMKVVEAVPLLLLLTPDGPAHLGMAGKNDAMLALIQIGKAAVPQVINFLDTADERAEMIKFGKSQFSTEQEIRFRQGAAAEDRAKAAIVLGEIGDATAIPILEKYLDTSAKNRDRADLPYVQIALDKIRKSAEPPR